MGWSVSTWSSPRPGSTAASCGKYLYFFASTNAGPVNHWFNLSSFDLRATRSLYLALLRKRVPAVIRNSRSGR
jgi:hypothetical protein